jgi:putative transposase
MQEQFRRRHLPHWDLSGATYFVTACLHGSIPALGLLDINDFQKSLERRPLPVGLSQTEWGARKWKLVFARTDEWLDLRSPTNHLADPMLAAQVRDSIYHFAGDRYDLLAYVVMPSHFHFLFRPIDDWVDASSIDGNERAPRERIMKSLKGYTAKRCNEMRERKGTFWQSESYDHCVFDEDELERIIHYIELNPVKAKLVRRREEWEFSSARDRLAQKVALGQPLRKI